MTKSKRAKIEPSTLRERFNSEFLSADYDGCMNLLEDATETEERLLLLARVLIRRKCYVDALAALSRLKPQDPKLRAEWNVLFGATLGYTKDFRSARKRLDRALAEPTLAPPLREEATYFSAVVAWMDQENREAEALVTTLMSSSNDNLRAQARILFSWILLRRRDARGQARELMAALDDLDRAQSPDQFVRANALFTLALLCRELSLKREEERVRSLYANMGWSSGTRTYRFQTTRFLGWMDALAGNDLSAFSRFKHASQLAPSAHWKVLCHLDRAYLARNTGERAFSLDQLHEADHLAASLSWSETDGEERSALLLLAELFADVDAALAQKYLALFRSLRTSVSPALSYGSDPRVHAFASFSAGVAQLRLGDREEASRLLTDAWAVFEDFGYGWRAALCAQFLAEATSDLKWLQRAKRQIEPWPHSWIARALAQSREQASVVSVSPAQRQVLDLLLQGKRNSEIAAVLNRSPHTVRNHIVQLFQLYDVRSRGELIATARKP